MGRIYDGANLVCYNRGRFTKNILPYLKHPQKINDTNLICFKKGKLNKRFLTLLKTIKFHNGYRITELAKVLKKSKVYAQIKVLKRLNYVKTNNYPKMVFITQKGLAALSQGGKDK